MGTRHKRYRYFAKGAAEIADSSYTETEGTHFNNGFTALNSKNLGYGLYSGRTRRYEHIFDLNAKTLQRTLRLKRKKERKKETQKERNTERKNERKNERKKEKQN